MIRPSFDTESLPDRAIATSELVPPMSKVMRSWMPLLSPAALPPSAPAAGPLSNVVTGRSITRLEDAMLPRDCMISIGAVIPISASAVSRRWT